MIRNLHNNNILTNQSLKKGISFETSPLVEYILINIENIDSKSINWTNSDTVQQQSDCNSIVTQCSKNIKINCTNSNTVQ